MSADGLLIDVRCYDATACSHTHDHHQLVLPVYGRLELEIDGQGGVVDNDHAAIICGQNRHAFAAPNANRFIVADVPVEWANMLDSLPPFLQLSDSLKSYIAFVAARTEQAPMSPHTRQQILMLMLDLMAEPLQQNIQIDKRVNLAKSFLDDHLAEKVTLSQVSAAAHLSVRQLSNLFKRQLGLSPVQYLRQARMKQAASLLMHSNDTVQRIAESVGYGSLAAFSERFYQHFGKYPSHYRQNNKT